MSKVLIINNQLKIIKAMQKNLCELNPILSQDQNIFCLSDFESCKIIPIYFAKELQPLDYVDYNKIKKTAKSILEFLEKNKGEHVLILIDGNLAKTGNFGNSFNCVNDLSAFLYAILLMFMNGKKSIDGQVYDVSNENFSFVLFSNAEYFLNRIIKSMKEIYQKLPEEAKKYFPEEALLCENISFVNGGGKCNICYATSFEEVSSDDYVQLKLPNSYSDFIRKL